MRRNGKNAARKEPASTAARSDSVNGSSNGQRRVERHTSQLTRRILPRSVDGRTKEAKRYAGLIRDLAKHVEDPDNPIVRAQLVGAALLVMEQEALAHKVAAGHAVDPDDTVRLHNACERALKRLGAS